MRFRLGVPVAAPEAKGNCTMSKLSLSATMLLLALALAPGAGSASEFPNRPIKMIVAFGAGGGPDTIARVVAAGLERQLGKAVVVENAPGASGAIALRAAARAEPNGYTIMMADMSFAVAPYFAENIDIKPLERFRAVGWAATAPLTLIVSSSLPAKTLPEFVALAKEKPEAVMIGHTGIGTTPHLAVASFSQATGIDPRLVPYRLIGDAMTNSMAGIISGLFSAASSAITAQTSDNLRVLGQTGERRIPQLSDVPTFVEQGITMRGFDHGTWFGVVAPVDTPDAVVKTIAAALDAARQDEDLKQRLSKVGATFKDDAAGSFGEFLHAQDEVWRAFSATLGQARVAN